MDEVALQVFYLLAAMGEDHRVSTFQANHVLAFSGGIEQETVDGGLLLVMIASSLAHIYLLGFFVFEIRRVDEVVVEDDVGLVDGFRSFDGKEVWVARTKANKLYLALAVEDALAGKGCS